ncbi:hypothetical protein P3T25_009648 [Paraburkholderia sp. GAS32]
MKKLLWVGFSLLLLNVPLSSRADSADDTMNGMANSTREMAHKAAPAANPHVDRTLNEAQPSRREESPPSRSSNQSNDNPD